MPNHCHIMKNNLLLAGLFIAVFLYGCSSAKYLPESDQVGVNQYGSQIEISTHDFTVLGELIVAKDSSLIILLDSDNPNEKSVKQIKIISVNKIQEFILSYAKHNDYSWTIPVFTLMTISHGAFLIFTLPLNLITTIAINSNASSGFQYNNYSIEYNQLKMFARFPQGIPSNVKLSDIK